MSWMPTVCVLAVLLPGLHAPVLAAADGQAVMGRICRSGDGGSHPLGASVCLDIGGQKHLARCEMVLNVTSWRKVREGCPEEDRPADPPG
ncbi:MAG: hypothetical protein QHC90_24750 [Shinella sp.]|jgi:hypothetical protein|nr:hypothetical protein [Shinella sp.]